MVRLRHSSPAEPGWTRRRRGRGFVYLDGDGERLADPVQVDRIRALTIPPAWRDVWVCPAPNGHLQAVGTDSRGRRQYLYHPHWRALRDREKHQRMTAFARSLPAARTRVAEHLALPGMPRERALATAFRLLDLGFFRVGGEIYAEENGSYGLATLRREHARLEGRGVVFDYVAKSGSQRTIVIADAAVTDAVRTLKRRRGGGEELLAWKDGRGWTDVVSEDINAYVKDVVGPSASAKDFRTWHATVLAAIALADAPDRLRSAAATKREVARAMREVAVQIGNTPSVCRASYVDPRLIDKFFDGAPMPSSLRQVEDGSPPGSTHRAVERAVLRLLCN